MTEINTIRPTEAQEEVVLSQALDRLWWFHSHIPNETFTKSRNVKNRNKAMWVSPGIPDHIVIIPKQWHNLLVFVELKRSIMKWKHKPYVRPEQVVRHGHIQSCNVPMIVWYWASDALNQLLEL